MSQSTPGSSRATGSSEYPGAARFGGAEAPSGTQSLQPAHDIWAYAREYARERPEVVALWCFGIGFVLGWKLKPW